jgi:glycosyltransferase involved in cell wall biosynthesis
MRLLLIHNEAEYYGGAQRLLGDFLSELVGREVEGKGVEVAVARVVGSRVAKLVPSGIRHIDLDDNRRFSPLVFVRQVRHLLQAHRAGPFDLAHGWAVRDWELTAIVGRLIRRPCVGTLHDHPRASFISEKRQRLMRLAARWGLQRVICVSAAVAAACEAAGYDRDRLTVIHNGVALPGTPPKRSWGSQMRLGFLGVFSERKGLRDLFRIADELARLGEVTWELHIGGEAQDEGSRQLMEGLKDRYSSAGWWPRVHWHGWVKSPLTFLEKIDLLICPCCEFEPFGLVLCEAGLAGIPVVAARVGGVGEIVQDGLTGWLYEPGDYCGAARIIAGLAADRSLCIQAGERGYSRVTERFGIAKMVAEYVRLYSTLTR